MRKLLEICAIGLFLIAAVAPFIIIGWYVLTYHFDTAYFVFRNFLFPIAGGWCIGTNVEKMVEDHTNNRPLWALLGLVTSALAFMGIIMLA